MVSEIKADQFGSGHSDPLRNQQFKIKMTNQIKYSVSKNLKLIGQYRNGFLLLGLLSNVLGEMIKLNSNRLLNTSPRPSLLGLYLLLKMNLFFFRNSIKKREWRIISRPIKVRYGVPCPSASVLT